MVLATSLPSSMALLILSPLAEPTCKPSATFYRLHGSSPLQLHFCQKASRCLCLISLQSLQRKFALMGKPLLVHLTLIAQDRISCAGVWQPFIPPGCSCRAQTVIACMCIRTLHCASHSTFTQHPSGAPVAGCSAMQWGLGKRSLMKVLLFNGRQAHAGPGREAVRLQCD